MAQRGIEERQEQAQGLQKHVACQEASDEGCKGNLEPWFEWKDRHR